MFGLFSKGPPKKNKKKNNKAAKPKNSAIQKAQLEKKKEEIAANKKAEEKSALARAELLENMAMAREHIGEDTLDKIADAMTAMQKSKIQQAKRVITGGDQTKMKDEMLHMIREDKK